MRVAITGATGFVGTHLTRRLLADGHDVVRVSRSPPSSPTIGEDYPGDLTDAEATITDRDALMGAFAGADAVAHLAGINRVRGEATFERVHVDGTETVARAAAAERVDRLLLSSYLRARPDCDSPYLETKWAAEQTVREIAVDHTVLKMGVTFGPSDHVVSHLARAIATAPMFPDVGLRDRHLAPLAIEDLVDVAVPALSGEALTDATVPVVGPETVPLASLVRRVARAMDRRVAVVPLPVAAHYVLAWLGTKLFAEPPIAPAQVRMLAEGAVEPAPGEVCDELPADLAPTRAPTVERLREALPQPVSRYGLGDLGTRGD